MFSGIKDFLYDSRYQLHVVLDEGDTAFITNLTQVLVTFAKIPLQMCIRDRLRTRSEFATLTFSSNLVPSTSTARARFNVTAVATATNRGFKGLKEEVMIISL